MSRNIPDIATLETATTELLREGPLQSVVMRQRLAGSFGVDPADEWWPRFVNNHAWALVRLQARGEVRKIAPGLYEALPRSPDRSTITEIPLQPLEGIATPAILPSPSPLPRWARAMLSTAASRNRKSWPEVSFSENDLRQLWAACGGCCARTGIPFMETQIGDKAARHPYRPSLDRIQSSNGYTLENCQLVLQAVNFGRNSFGDDIFDRWVHAAVEHQRKAREH